MKKIRLSHTLLSLWERGDYNAAVETYFHLDREITPQMKDGRRIHEEIADHIQKYNIFPEWFFDHRLHVPEVEKELVVPYNEWFDLKCFIDCYDSVPQDIFEYKTGVSDSLTWARTYQLPLYFLISELAGMHVNRGFLIHHNQYKKETDFVIVHNTEGKRDKARNFIDSVGPEIYTFFEKEGLV